jgi:hypothetical protein
MGTAYCAFFAQIWFSSVKRRGKIEVALRLFTGESPLSTSLQLSESDFTSAELKSHSPPPRTGPEN